MSVDSDGTTRWRGVLSGANPIARVVWNMLKEGMVHLGVSVGGKINGVRPGRDAIGRTCNLITDVRLDELSITDNPANRLIESETPDNGAYITALAKSVGNTMLAQKQQHYIYLNGIAYTAHPSEEHGIVLRKAGRRRVPSPGQLGLFGGHNEGDTKVEDGVTYRLNANSRWERMDKPKASGKPSGGKMKAEKPAIVPVVEAEKGEAKPEDVEPSISTSAEPKASRTSRSFTAETLTPQDIQLSDIQEVAGEESLHGEKQYSLRNLFDPTASPLKLGFFPSANAALATVQDEMEFPYYVGEMEMAAGALGRIERREAVAEMVLGAIRKRVADGESVLLSQGRYGMSSRNPKSTVIDADSVDLLRARNGNIELKHGQKWVQHTAGFDLLELAQRVGLDPEALDAFISGDSDPEPTVSEMLEQQQAAIADEPMPEGEAMEGADDDWESKLQELQSIGNQAKLDGPEGVKDDATEAPGVSYNPDLVQQRINQGYFEGRAFYSKAVQAMKAALSAGRSVKLHFDDQSSYGANLVAEIDGVRHPITRSKLKPKDIAFLLTVNSHSAMDVSAGALEQLGLGSKTAPTGRKRSSAFTKSSTPSLPMTIDNFLRKALGNPGREFGSGAWRDTGIPAMGRKVDAKSPQPKGGKEVQMDESGSAHAGKGIGGKQPKAHRPYSSGGMPPTDVFGITITQLTRNLAKACYMDKDAWGSPETVSFLTDSARAIAGMTDTPTDPMVNFVRFLQYCTRFAQELPFMNDYQAAGTVKAMNADLTKALDEFVEKMPEELKGKPLRPAGSPGVVGIDVQFPQQYVIYS
jgi:hypothetical protein